MTTISGQDIKLEIIKTKPKGEDCVALLCGFVRACMTLSLTRDDGLILQLDCQSDKVREYIAALMLQQYKVGNLGTSSRDNHSSVGAIERSPSLKYGDCEKLLKLLGIFEQTSDGCEMASIPRMSEQAQSAYVRGVFLGCGSFSARDTDGSNEHRGGGGYHLEFSVLSEDFADGLTALLQERNVCVHKMVRADKFVVYAKDSENISNCLALMQLGKFVLKLNDTVVALSIKKDVNRRINCDVANMTRTANAAVDVMAAIERIRRAASGRSLLPPKLEEAADARVNSPFASLDELAYELGISKSGLKHRFDSILKIAEQYGDRE